MGGGGSVCGDGGICGGSGIGIKKYRWYKWYRCWWHRW